ncbi:MAG: hypothetical protein V1897_00685 [Pseudomonadota bacterium]
MQIFKAGGIDCNEASIPSIPAVQVRIFGSFPLWRGQDNFLEFLERIYAKASPVGLEIFLGESGTGASLK